MLEFNFNWDKLSVSAGLTLRNFYFRIGELEAEALVRHIDGPWTGCRRTAAAWCGSSSIATEYLPPYAPELNPVAVPRKPRFTAFLPVIDQRTPRKAVDAPSSIS